MKRITATLAALAVAAGLAIASTPTAEARERVYPKIAVPTHPALPDLCIERIGRKHHRQWVQYRCPETPSRTVPIPHLPPVAE